MEKSTESRFSDRFQVFKVVIEYKNCGIKITSFDVVFIIREDGVRRGREGERERKAG